MVLPHRSRRRCSSIPTYVSAAIFIFRGRRGDMIKALHWDGQGLVLDAKRLEQGRFVWPQATDGTVSLTAAQLSMLVEGIDWRRPVWTARPQTEVQI